MTSDLNEKFTEADQNKHANGDDRKVRNGPNVRVLKRF